MYKMCNVLKIQTLEIYIINIITIPAWEMWHLFKLTIDTAGRFWICPYIVTIADLETKS